jgi:hypothetical protein
MTLRGLLGWFCQNLNLKLERTIHEKKKPEEEYREG